jgi:hypothetical protein
VLGRNPLAECGAFALEHPRVAEVIEWMSWFDWFTVREDRGLAWSWSRGKRSAHVRWEPRGISCVGLARPTRTFGMRECTGTHSCPSVPHRPYRTAVRFPLRGQQKAKKPTGGFFTFWWSRGESNPRPQVIYDQFYMRSRFIFVSAAT